LEGSIETDLVVTEQGIDPSELMQIVRMLAAGADSPAPEHENERHWARDTQLGEDAHRDAHRIRAPVFSLLRTAVMNLLRRGGCRSIRRGLRLLSHDIKGMLALCGVRLVENST
jgi:hypothetical protein